MTNRYFLPLNVDKQKVIRSDWVIPFDTVIDWKKADYVKSMLTDEFFDKLDGVSKVVGAMIFTRGTEPSYVAHLDLGRSETGQVYATECALNFIFYKNESDEGLMRWYSLKQGEIDLADVRYNPAKTAYLRWELNECNLETEHSISEYPTLVRTDVPHDVIAKSGTRTCVSIRFQHQGIGWEAQVEKFNKAFNL